MIGNPLQFSGWNGGIEISTVDLVMADRGHGAKVIVEIVHHYAVGISPARFEAGEEMLVRCADGLHCGARFSHVLPIQSFFDGAFIQIENLQPGEVGGTSGGDGGGEREQRIDGHELGEDCGFPPQRPIEGGDFAAVGDVERAVRRRGNRRGRIAAAEGEDEGFVEVEGVELGRV